jgi:hypothetical protein
MPILLNGFNLALSATSVAGCAGDCSDPALMEALRERHAGKWFLYWRGGKFLGLPLADAPRPDGSRPCTLALADLDTLHLLATRIGEVLPTLFPGYNPFRRRRAFSFLARKQDAEIVARITKDWSGLHPLIARFTIRPKFDLEARIIEPRAGETSIGLFLNVVTRWQIHAPVQDLAAAGIDLSGLAVVRRAPMPGQRSLVGTVEALRGDQVILKESFDDLRSIAAGDVWVEGSRASFGRCLRPLLGNRYDRFESGRLAEEAKLLTGPEFDRIVTEMGGFLKRKGQVTIASGLTFRLGDRIELANTPDYQSVRTCADAEYCFDAAKSKRHPYAWKGLLRFGPFDRDTFSKRSPRILVVCPEQAAGRVSAFVGHLKNGITSLQGSQYQKGLAATFGLANPTFATLPVRLLGVAEGRVAATYRAAIEARLSAPQETFDAAFVVLDDAHARLPDAMNPYLHAKAVLLLHGVPSQQCRLSTISAPEQNLQWKLPNLAVALYAKLGGTPWTVAQSQTADDELVIGMGMAELSGSRFDTRHRYMGITTVFRGDGNYLLSNVSRVCGYDQYPEELRRTTTALLQELRARNGWRAGDTVRIVFHARKPLKNVEVAAIVGDCVRDAGKDINVEFAFLSIEAGHPFRLLDSSQPGVEKGPGGGRKGAFAPHRGTIAQLGRHTRLLATNGPRQVKRTGAPLPSPLLIHLHRDSRYVDLDYLAEQVLRFTSLTWRSTLPASAPVTIYYSELIADLLFRLQAVPDWTPALLNTKLKFNRWFL